LSDIKKSGFIEKIDKNWKIAIFACPIFDDVIIKLYRWRFSAELTSTYLEVGAVQLMLLVLVRIVQLPLV
jgi:hypothetical protein